MGAVVSEIESFGERLTEIAAATDTAVEGFITEALKSAADRMRDEIPVDEGDERDSVTVEVDSDGLGGSVGPTKVDPTGKPTGFFLLYGARSASPNDFIGRTTAFVEGEIKPMADELLEGLF